MSIAVKNSQTKVSADLVKRLKSKLPYGAYKIISEKTGYSYTYVARVIQGKRYNKDVILCAIELAKEKNEEVETVEKQIAEL